jgi:hypothetical protein
MLKYHNDDGIKNEKYKEMSGDDVAQKWRGHRKLQNTYAYQTIQLVVEMMLLFA